METKTSVMDAWIHQKCFPSHPWTRKELEQWQFCQLKRLICHVKEKSPFYRNLYQAFPMPETQKDFQTYPVIDEQQLLLCGSKMVCVSQREISRVVTLDTSGTTQKPKRLFFTTRDQELTVNFFSYGMEQLVYPGEKTAVFLPFQTPGCVGDLLIKALAKNNRIGIGMGIMNDIPQVVKTLQKEHIPTAVGIPVQFLGLLEYAQKHGIQLPLTRILTSTDLLSQALRKRLEAFHLEVFDHFGMTECGLGAALECGIHKGMHIRENDLFIEILDEDNHPVPDGVWGQLTITTLTRKAMPLIRYKTGDLCRILPGSCPCGSILKRLEIKERVQKHTWCGLTIRQLDELLFDFPKITDYKVHTDREQKPTLTLYGFYPFSFKETEGIRRTLLDQTEFPDSQSLEIRQELLTDRLPVYTGKRKIAGSFPAER